MTDTDNPNDYYERPLAVGTYDTFYEQGLAHSPVAGDIDFYIARARELIAKKEGGRVLELGVGTGRVAIPLAEAGFDVTGVDLSPAMLAVARRRIEERGLGGKIKLVEAGMEDFALGDRFDLALIPFRAFHHVATAAGQRRALENIRAHLKSGGLLIFDIFDADLASVVPDGQSPAQPREIIDPRTGQRVRRTTISRVNDPFAQTIRENMRVETLDAEGRTIAAEDASFTLRWATYNEMACMLELARFRDLVCYGDFKGGPPGYKREQIWLGRA